MTETKFAAPKAIHLPCLVEVGTFFYRGGTLDLSEHEATVQIPALAFPAMRKPKHGESAVLTLDLHSLKEVAVEILKIHCKVSYLATIVVGLRLNTQFLSEQQQKIYAAVLEMET